MGKTHMCRENGLVKFEVMKLHIVLQALCYLNITLTGLYRRPNDICTDSDNGTRETWNVEILLSKKHG
jgi:hypothetical protein